MRESEFQVIDALFEESVIAQRADRKRSRPRRAPGARIILQASVAAQCGIVREGRIYEGSRAGAQAKAIRAVLRTVSVPRLQDIEIERNRDGLVRSEMVE